jgi:site-specific DNA-methyltransferase (adenine-specific)/site-specific DNA-methyltransferase (cytosine-N4-specific)
MFQQHAHLVPDHSVDLVATSPPYANQRKTLYGGIAETDFPAWTVDWMRLVKRVLKPTGSVAIVIRPHVTDGQISDYMLRTRLALRDDGWRECDEWIWHKPDAPPIGNHYRPRRNWESIHWFSRVPQPYCDPRANGQTSQRIGFYTRKGLGQQFQSNGEHVTGIARVGDVILTGIYEIDKSEWNIHPAQYPVPLAEQIIMMLCPRHGVVLDPFIGSGTTAVAALRTQCQYIGFEKELEYVKIAERRISLCQHPLITFEAGDAIVA